MSGVTGPMGSYGSRCPSPTMSSVGKRMSILLSIPSPPLQTNVPIITIIAVPQSGSPPAMAHVNLSIQANVTSYPNSSVPLIVTPTSVNYSVAESGSSSPTMTTLEPHQCCSRFSYNCSIRQPHFPPPLSICLTLRPLSSPPPELCPSSQTSLIRAALQSTCFGTHFPLCSFIGYDRLILPRPCPVYRV